MVTLPVIGSPLTHEATLNSTFCVDFHNIFIVGERTKLKFNVQVHYSKSQATDDKLFRKRAWSRHVTHFKFLAPRNGLRLRLQILYTGWAHEVLASGLINSPSSGCGHGHVISLNSSK